MKRKSTELQIIKDGALSQHHHSPEDQKQLRLITWSTFYQTLSWHENTPDLSCPQREVCDSDTSEQTHTLARSVSDLHTLPPQTPASCDNTKTRPPEGRFVRLLFCVSVTFRLRFQILKCVFLCVRMCVCVDSVLKKLLHILGNILV